MPLPGFFLWARTLGLPPSQHHLSSWGPLSTRKICPLASSAPEAALVQPWGGVTRLTSKPGATPSFPFSPLLSPSITATTITFITAASGRHRVPKLGANSRWHLPHSFPKQQANPASHCTWSKVSQREHCGGSVAAFD